MSGSKRSFGRKYRRARGERTPLKRVREGRLIDTAAERPRSERGRVVAARKGDGERWKDGRDCGGEGDTEGEKERNRGGKVEAGGSRWRQSCSLSWLENARCRENAVAWPPATPDPE